MIIDTHAHIDSEEYKYQFEQILQNAQANGVEKIIIPAAEPANFERIFELTQKYENIYGAMGVHPSDAQKYTPEVENKIKEYCNNRKITAIGECGLDYYWDKTFVDLQKEIFKKQILLANELEKTLIVHDRDAHLDSLTLLKENVSAKTPVVMHCFSGSYEFGLECVKQGWFIAFGGVVTFKNAKKTHEAATKLPLENLLLETDSPYLTPEPHRGEVNQPAYTKFVAKRIAELRGITVEKVEQITTENAKRAFKLQ